MFCFVFVAVFPHKSHATVFNQNNNSQAMDTSPPRLFPRSVPDVKLIIPQGYIQGNTGTNMYGMAHCVT